MTQSRVSHGLRLKDDASVPYLRFPLCGRFYLAVIRQPSCSVHTL